MHVFILLFCLFVLYLWIIFYTLHAFTARKVSKYGVISGPYFPVFNPNTGKYRPEITPYPDAFHAVFLL